MIKPSWEWERRTLEDPRGQIRRTQIGCQGSTGPAPKESTDYEGLGGSTTMVSAPGSACDVVRNVLGRRTKGRLTHTSREK